MTSVVTVSRLLHTAGLVEGFGHVSTREGRITSIRPFTEPTTVPLEDDGGADRPLETPLHRAIYAARSDVKAICRTHSRAAVAWGSRREIPPLVHGLGAMAGTLALHDDPQLVDDDERGEAVARALGHADCVLLYANGAVATGDSLEQAAVRAFYLEERARVALDAGPDAVALSGHGLEDRLRHTAAEEARAWRWLTSRYRTSFAHEEGSS